MKKILLILLAFWPFVGFSQQQDSIVFSEPRYWAGISPLGLIDGADGFSVRINAEAPVFKRFAIGLEGGFYPGLSLGPYKEKVRGNFIKPVIKYYFTSFNYKMRYMGLEYMYKHEEYNMRDSLSIDNINFEHIEKKYAIDRYVNAVSVKYGEITRLWSTGLFIDFYVGLGLRFNNSRSSLSKEEEDAVLTGMVNNVDHGESMIKEFSRYSGHYVTPNFLLGFRLIYKIK